jgi:hypothetical protein
MAHRSLVLALPLLLSGGGDEVGGELARLRLQVASLELALRQRDERLEAATREIRALAEALAGLKEGFSSPAAAPFLSGPPPSSDTAGVAAVAVFAPRVEVVQSARRHDTVFLKLRRIEPNAIRVLPEVQLEAGELSVELPLDQNGALYMVDWSTSEGHDYSLVLRDGATGQSAASVQVKPLQNQGKLIFVGYRLE